MKLMGAAGEALAFALLASALLLSPLACPAGSAPPARPQCSITRPYSDATESGKLRVTGTAVWASDPVIRVQLRIDGGSVLIANGTDSWHFDLDTTRLSNGRHTIEAKSFDGSQYSESATVSFLVNNSKAPEPDGTRLLYRVAGICVILVVVAVAVAIWRLRGRARR